MESLTEENDAVEAQRKIKSATGIPLKPDEQTQPGTKTSTFDISKEPWYFLNNQTFDEQDVTDFSKKVQLVLVVANKREFDTVRSKLEPIEPYRERYIYKLYAGEQTYYVGKFGVLNAALLLLTTMGSSDEGASLVSISDAVTQFEPYIVVLLGVGWGKGGKDQEIGDVLVARHIIPLQSNQRISEDKTIDRFSIPSCTTVLINRFQNNIESWKRNTLIKPKKEWNLFSNRNTMEFDVHIGDICSANYVLDNADKKREILNKYPSVIGGDMESWGLYISTNRWKADHTRINWILVKSICDLGTKKSDDYQYLAAATASDFVCHVFRSEAAVKDLLPRVDTMIQIYDNNSNVVEDVTKYSFMFTPVLTYDINCRYFQLVNLSALMISFIENGTFRNYVETKYSREEVPAILHGKDGLYIITCGYDDKDQKWFNHKKMAKLYNFIVTNFPKHKFPTTSHIIDALDTKFVTPDVPFKTNHSVYLPYVANSWKQMLAGSILVMAHRGRDQGERDIENALYASNKVMYIIDSNCALGNTRSGKKMLRFCNKVAYCVNDEKNIYVYEGNTQKDVCDVWTTFTLDDEYKEFCIK